MSGFYSLIRLPTRRPKIASQTLLALGRCHPWFAAAAPILFLAAANIDQITAASLFLPLAIALAATTVLFAGLWLACRNAQKAALITTAAVALFFAYGHLYGAAAEWVHHASRAWVNVAATAATLALLAALACAIWRTGRSLDKLAQFAALLAAALLATSTWQIADEYRHYHRQLRREAARAARSKTGAAQKAPDGPDADPSSRAAPCDPVPVPERIAPVEQDTPELPDIYYIIPDGYARADLLQTVYGFDNSEFIEGLRRRGFYVAERSHTNYPMTFLSLASSLNMRYINDDVEGLGRQRRPVYKLIHDHAVGHYLQAKGYRCLHIASNWGGTERSDVADVTYRPGFPFLQQEFVGVLLRTTLLHPLVPHVARTHLFAFDTLEEVPAIAGPTFTFVHVVAPHHPYVLDRDGHVLQEVPLSLQFDKDGNPGWKDLEGYTEQLRFVNRRITEVIDTIQRRSPRPPVIIVQADHGTATRKADDIPTGEQLDFIRERMPILNAYCVPEACRRRLYPEISPVNSFRLLLGSLFGDDLELLPDRHFFAWYGQPYKLQDVTHLFRPPAELPGSLVGVSAITRTTQRR